MNNLLRNNDVIAAMATRYETALSREYKLAHNISDPISKKLSNRLVGDATKANRYEILQVESVVHFRNQRDQSMI